MTTGDECGERCRSNQERWGRWARCSAGVLLLSGVMTGLAGCSMPFSVKSDVPGVQALTERQTQKSKAAKQEKAAKQAGRQASRPAEAPTPTPNTDTNPESTPEREPVYTLRVNEDTVEAAEILAEVRPELVEKAGSMAPVAYRSHVVELALQRVRDKATELLLYQAGAEQMEEAQLKQVDTIVDSEIRRIVTTGYGGVQRRYEREYLEPRGLTLEDARARLRREVVITFYLEENVKPKVPEPTRAELWELYEANREQWQRPARRRMGLIDVRVSDRLDSPGRSATEEERQSARAEAQTLAAQALEELRQGADFAEVARRHSSGSHAQEGGAWGWLTRGSVTERFKPAEDALFKMNEGQISEVLETEDSFFIVRCAEIDPGQEPSFEQAQPQLKERQFRIAYNRLIAAEVDRLQADASIEPADMRQFLAAVLETAPEPETGSNP